MESKIIAERIKKLRNSHNLTQQELAEICGVKKASVSFWEHGRVSSLKTTCVRKMADYFNISPAYLIFEEVTKMEKQSEREMSLTAQCEGILTEMNESQLETALMFLKTLKGASK